MGTDLERRKALVKGGGLLAMLGLVAFAPSSVWAAGDRAAFSSKKMEEALSALGISALEENPILIHLTVPEIAENGAVVPVSVSTTIPDVEQIYILVDKNPNVLAANFSFPPGTEATITSRVKMGQTANVVALVKAGGKCYRTAREVKVTAGGCGG